MGGGQGPRGPAPGGGGKGQEPNRVLFLAMEGHPPRADTRIQQGLRKVPKEVHRRHVGVARVTCGWPWARPCTWRHSQALGAVFDHSPMAPPIVLPVKAPRPGCPERGCPYPPGLPWPCPSSPPAENLAPPSFLWFWACRSPPNKLAVELL